MKNIAWKCPNCASPLVPMLEQKPYVLRCERGHSFDLAKQGYVNLLRTNKSGDRIGDDKLSARSRRDFLNKGYYSLDRNIF